MPMLCAADFYYGAFLSALLKDAGIEPSLFDETASRRIYRISTNKSKKDYMVFTKYRKAQKNKTDKFDHWIFIFSNDEIKSLQDLHKNEEVIVKIALVCVTHNLKGGEIALIDYDQAMDCLGSVGSPRINIKAINDKHGLRMYGSGRADMLNGDDNTLKVPRNALREL